MSHFTTLLDDFSILDQFEDKSQQQKETNFSDEFITLLIEQSKYDQMLPVLLNKQTTYSHCMEYIRAKGITEDFLFFYDNNKQLSHALGIDLHAGDDPQACLEGLGDFLKAIWDGIMKVIDAIIDFFKKIINTILNLFGLGDSGGGGGGGESAPDTTRQQHEEIKKTQIDAEKKVDRAERTIESNKNSRSESAYEDPRGRRIVEEFKKEVEAIRKLKQAEEKLKKHISDNEKKYATLPDPNKVQSLTDACKDILSKNQELLDFVYKDLRNAPDYLNPEHFEMELNDEQFLQFLDREATKREEQLKQTPTDQADKVYKNLQKVYDQTLSSSKNYKYSEGNIEPKKIARALKLLTRSCAGIEKYRQTIEDITPYLKSLKDLINKLKNIQHPNVTKMQRYVKAWIALTVSVRENGRMLIPSLKRIDNSLQSWWKQIDELDEYLDKLYQLEAEVKAANKECPESVQI